MLEKFKLLALFIMLALGVCFVVLGIHDETTLASLTGGALLGIYVMLSQHTD